MRLTLGHVESLLGASVPRTHRILRRTTGPARDIPVARGMGRPPESSAGAPHMKAVILAAGEGARMGPFTASVPKVMIPVGNRPLLEYVVQALAENGVRDLIFVVGYRRERIQSHFQDGKAFGAHITYVTQTKQLGTAHAIWEARGHLEDPFIVLNGSNMVDARSSRTSSPPPRSRPCSSRKASAPRATGSSRSAAKNWSRSRRN